MSDHVNAFVPTTRQWLVAVICLLVLLGAGLYRTHTVLYDHARSMAEHQLQSVATLRSREIQRWLDDRLVFLSEPPDGVMAQNLTRLLKHRDDASANRALQARFRHVHAAIPEIAAIGLYDLAGHPVLGSKDAHSLSDEHHHLETRHVLEQRRAGLIDFHRLDDATGKVVLDILVPLSAGPEEEEGGTGAMVGYALFEIDPTQVLYPMLSRWPVSSSTAESLLARREGTEVVFLNPLLHQAAPPLSLRLPVDTPGLVLGKVLRGEGEVQTGVDYRGEPVLAVVLRNPDTDWLLIAKMDDSEIYRDARREFLWISVVSLLFLAALLALGRVFVTALRARAREARYRILAESGSDMVWLYELAAQRFTYASPSVERLRGYTVAESLQQTMQEVMTPESYRMVAEELPKWLGSFAAGGASDRTRNYQLTQTCKDGTTIETEVVATLIADAQGRPTHIQGISRDISERKRAENELRKLSLAAEQSPVSIVITNLDAEIEYVNEAFVRATGYSREEAHGQNPRILQSGRTPRASYEEMWANLSQGLPWEGELYNRRKDGSEYVELASITPIRQSDGRITHYLAVKEDITERRRVEAALAESEEKFRTIYDTINDALFIHDAVSGRILDVNAKACQMYGCSREQLLALDVGAFSAGTSEHAMKVALERLQQAHEKGWQAFDWLARDSTGRQFWVAVNLQRLQLGGGQRVLAVVRDIDSRKHAEEDLKRALAEAKALNIKLTEAQSQLLQSEKMASIGQLAAGVAHELNNPIGFVSSNLGTLESYLKDIFAITTAYEAAEVSLGDQCPPLEAVKSLKAQKDFDYLKTDIGQLMAESKDGLARVAKIVRDLKDFSRAGDATFHWADLHQGLESTLNIVWNELKYKCTVKKEYGELPQVWCVPSHINQVFMNLLVNAANAIPVKGEITIRTGRQGEEVFVAVSDTGTGIAPEHLNRVFEPFFTTKPVGQGTGLGLSLAYSIVQKHHGRIDVESEVGKGTTFTIWLPIEAKEAEGAETA
ncbi:MAG: PAS domain S-box protein [Sulfuritalea sp.]|jgi:PAS domain S-box-containing protein|nr:PAS domain S-box protein [Sulfuritalea sp.]